MVNDLQALVNASEETRLVVRNEVGGTAKLILQEKCLCETTDNPECEGKWVDHFCICAYDKDRGVVVPEVETVQDPKGV